MPQWLFQVLDLINIHPTQSPICSLKHFLQLMVENLTTLSTMTNSVNQSSAKGQDVSPSRARHWITYPTLTQHPTNTEKAPDPPEGNTSYTRKPDIGSHNLSSNVQLIVLTQMNIVDKKPKNENQHL